MKPGSLKIIPNENKKKAYGCQKCGKCCNQFVINVSDGKETFVPSFKKIYGTGFVDVKAVVVRMVARCEHLDENNLCKIYDKRPKRCRDYLCVNAQRLMD